MGGIVMPGLLRRSEPLRDPEFNRLPGQFNSALLLRNTMLAPLPFERIQFASSQNLFGACQRFTLGEGYAINK